QRGFADQTRDAQIVALRRMKRLSDSDDRAALHHASNTQTRFCCKHGPDVACAIADFAPPLIARAAWPMQLSPVTMNGSCSGVLIVVSFGSASASRRMLRWCG